MAFQSSRNGAFPGFILAGRNVQLGAHVREDINNKELISTLVSSSPIACPLLLFTLQTWCCSFCIFDDIMPPTQRGKGRPKIQARKKRSSNSRESSGEKDTSIFTTKAWTSIQRKDRWSLFRNERFTEQEESCLFGLPAEILNQILTYVFPPRKVDIKERHYANTDFIAEDSPAWSLVLRHRSKVQTKQRPGSGLLLTCRYAYELCRPLFYGNTIFFLATGELAKTISLAKVVRPANLELITSIGIRLEAADFGCKEWKLLREYCDSMRARGTYFVLRQGIPGVAPGLLRAIWYKKMEWVYKHAWQSLREIHLDCPPISMVLRLDDFRSKSSLTDFAKGGWFPADPDLRRFLKEASYLTNKILDPSRWIRVYEL